MSQQLQPDDPPSAAPSDKDNPLISKVDASSSTISTKKIMTLSKIQQRQSYGKQTIADILHKFESEEKQTHIKIWEFADKYKLRRSTVYGWYKNKDIIYQQVAEYSHKVIRIRQSRFPELDNKLYIWICDMRSRNKEIPLPRSVLIFVALRLFEETYKNQPHMFELLTKQSKSKKVQLALKEQSSSDSDSPSLLPLSPSNSQHSNGEETHSNSEETHSNTEETTANSDSSSSDSRKKHKKRIRTEPEEDQQEECLTIAQPVSAETTPQAGPESANQRSPWEPVYYTPRGIDNPAQSCFIISVLQQLFMHTQLRETILHWKILFPDSLQTAISLPQINEELHITENDLILWKALWKLFFLLSSRNSVAARLGSFLNTYVSLFPNAQSPYEQGDPAEFLSTLVEQLEESLRNKLQAFPNFIHQFFYYRLRTTVVCPHNHLSPTEHDLYLIRVLPHLNLIHSLQEFIKPETISYRCSSCGIESEAVAVNKFAQLPNTLIFSIKRFIQTEVDGVAASTFIDSEFEFPFDTYLDMNPYMAKVTDFEDTDSLYTSLTTPPTITIEDTHDNSQPTRSLRTPEDYARAVGESYSPPLIRQTSKPKAKTPKARSKAVSKLAASAAQQVEYQSGLFSLVGVVCHYGTLDIGHHFSLIKHRETRQWYLFSDNIVEPINENLIPYIAFGTPSTNTASSREKERKLKKNLSQTQKELFHSHAYILIYERIVPQDDWPVVVTHQLVHTSQQVPTYTLHPKCTYDPQIEDKFKAYHTVRSCCPSKAVMEVSGDIYLESQRATRQITNMLDPQSLSEAEDSEDVPADQTEEVEQNCDHHTAYSGPSSDPPQSANTSQGPQAQHSSVNLSTNPPPTLQCSETSRHPQIQSSTSDPPRKQKLTNISTSTATMIEKVRKESPEWSQIKTSVEMWRKKYLCLRFEDIKPASINPYGPYGWAIDIWLRKWLYRRGIKNVRGWGTSGSADRQAKQRWIKAVLQPLLKVYTPDCIYNADESGLFYKMLPTSTYTLAGTSTTGYSLPKERFTILLTISMDGKMRTPVIIGRWQNVKKDLPMGSNPFLYYFQKNAWMDSDIWTNYLQKWDAELTNKPPVLLIVDNCSSHLCNVPLKNIRIEYLPPNLSSILQPCDNGTNRSWKCRYRAMLAKEKLLHRDLHYKAVDYILLAVRAARLPEVIVTNSFVHAGWSNKTITPIEEENEYGEFVEEDMYCVEPYGYNASVETEDSTEEVSNPPQPTADLRKVIQYSTYLLKSVPDLNLTDEEKQKAEQELTIIRNTAQKDFQNTATHPNITAYFKPASP